MPDAWPAAVCDPMGYAGGLGPGIVTRQWGAIRAAAEGRTFWLDMERRVRTPDDAGFDLTRVWAVCQEVAALVGGLEGV